MRLYRFGFGVIQFFVHMEGMLCPVGKKERKKGERGGSFLVALTGYRHVNCKYSLQGNILGLQLGRAVHGPTSTLSFELSGWG